MAGQSCDGNRGGVRGRAVGAWCRAAGLGASVSTVWAGNLGVVSGCMAQAREDDVGRVGGFLRAGKCRR